MFFELISDPYLLQQGRLDVSVIEDDGETATIAVQYESRLVDLLRPRVRRYTHEDQQLDYPGDDGFGYVAALQDMKIIWGGPAAAASPVAVPTPAPGPGGGNASEWQNTGRRRQTEDG